jgi:curved DNA-binding protein
LEPLKMAADFYAELGLEKGATPDEIKKAYRKLAAQLHPDKHPDDARAEDRFKRVNRAHQVLSDPKQRALYDEFGEDGLREGFDADAMRAYRRAGAGGGRRVHFRRGPGGFEVGDLGDIGDLFGDLFGARRAAPTRGSDVASEVEVDFAAALRGATLRLRVHEHGDEISVRIPPGAGDGDKVRVRGQGAPGERGGVTGDLVLVIRVKPHPYFTREGLDLYLDLPITPGEAHHGGKVAVPTIDGNVNLTIPGHSQSGQVLRLRGKGVRRKSQTGDLYVRFLIRLPDTDQEAVQEAIATLDGAMRSDLRADIKF